MLRGMSGDVRWGMNLETAPPPTFSLAQVGL